MFDIVYQDHALLVLDKASGVSVLADRTGAPCLWDELKKRYPRPRLVHRIDKGTSGLLLVALTADCQQTLARALNKGQIRKHYLAVSPDTSPRARRYASRYRSSAVEKAATGGRTARGDPFVEERVEFAATGTERVGLDHSCASAKDLGAALAAGGTATHRARPSDSRAPGVDWPRDRRRPPLRHAVRPRASGTAAGLACASAFRTRVRVVQNAAERGIRRTACAARTPEGTGPRRGRG